MVLDWMDNDASNSRPTFLDYDLARVDSHGRARSYEFFRCRRSGSRIANRCPGLSLEALTAELDDNFAYSTGFNQRMRALTFPDTSLFIKVVKRLERKTDERLRSPMNHKATNQSQSMR